MRRIRIIILSLVLAALGLCFYPILTTQAVSHSSTGLSRTEQLLLGSTVQISLFPEDGAYYEQGLGTIVSYNGILGKLLFWTSSQMGYAAQFPSGFFQLMEMSDSIGQSHEGVGKRRHGEEDVP